ncbi:uncharacterized protein LOC126792283 [Argentina anserina]|uniref:uncharacterized protein LOC126792283 n=1 Tax=Argentina anserina TaxID=57926 RepID=UPI002176398B|nr:uncharacterized protein LOC126792283 [Potentilla anserina]
MPGLSPDLGCNRLPIIEGYKPVQQSPRRMSADTAAAVKKEVQNMFQAGIIRPAKYSQWLSNIVPVRKKNDKIRVCVDYRNLNVATPKDVYPMPVADMLVDAVAGHELLSFMDDTTGYHQIPVYEPDRHKTAFRCPGLTRVFEYNNMPFVHERDIEVAEDKARAVLDTPAPRNKKELQCLLGKINFLRCFISNSAGKTAVFSPLLKLKADQEFQWGPAQQAVFDKIKEYLTHPPVLRPSRPGVPLKLYISASPYSIAGLLAQDVVVAQTDLVKYMLTRHMLRGRIGKWILALSEFSLQYTPLKALTGHAVSDFLLQHPIMEDVEDQNVLEWKCTNNQAEYEAIIIGLELLLDLEVTELEILGDSLLVINQLKGVYRWRSQEDFEGSETHITFLYDKERDWRQPIIQYLTDPSAPVDKRVRYFATNYVLRGGELLRRAEDGLYLRCIYGGEAKRCLREVHCGNCGSHKAGPKMWWLIRRYGFYWPTMLKDCISFAQGCIECQMHGPVQHVPDVPLQPIIKPWLGRGWALDFIGEIHPNSSLQHKHILLATYFFTKWVEAIPVRTTSSEGACFMAEKTQKFLAGYGIKFLHSSPYYAQANGQAEASNRVIMSILKRMLDANPRSWHTELDHTLWAYRTSKRTPTGTTPYALMYGHDAVLPIEINGQSLRVREQHQLIGEDYVQAMYQEHEDLDSRRMEVLDSLIAEKKKIARLYDKRTRGRNFGVCDLVWKAFLPYGERVDGRGK